MTEVSEVGEEEAGATLSFTLHLDKSLSCQVEKAAWNPEKDLLAMVTRDHQLIVHRFNWQRLWAISPVEREENYVRYSLQKSLQVIEKKLPIRQKKGGVCQEMKVTSLCWRPDGKALAVGHDDGSIAIHDVENGDVLRQLATHKAAVECLYWAEEGNLLAGQADDVFSYEDRTPRFLPSPPRIPPMPGTAPAFDMSGVLGPAAEDQGNANRKAVLRAVQQRLYVLCSGDRDGIICLSAFGVFPIGKLDIRDLAISGLGAVYKSGAKPVYRLLDASALQVSLSDDLRNMTVICSGVQSMESLQIMAGAESRAPGLYAISVDTSLLGDRRKELRQVALQASSVEELLEVVQATVSVMRKQWDEAISSFQDKFRPLSALLLEHGSTVKPRDEFLSLLSCGSASAALHQFLAASLGEGGLKRLAKIIDTAERELHNLIAEHLQPAAETIAFRIGELRGLSRWRARFRRVGLHEALMERAMEDSGMLLVQVERLLRTVSDTTGQFRLFFFWLTKSLRQLNGDVVTQGNQLPVINSAGVAAFLRSQFEKDPIGPHLAPHSDGHVVDLNPEDEIRMVELALMGGFSDPKYLRRTLSSQIHELYVSCQEAFAMPVKEVSPNLRARCMLPLCPLPPSLPPLATIPLSLTYFEHAKSGVTKKEGSSLEDYICLRMEDDISPTHQNVVGIMRGFTFSENSATGCKKVPEVIALRIDKNLQCIDLALYKQRQVLLLVSERDLEDKRKTVQTYLMLLQLEDLEFMPLSVTTVTANGLSLLHLCSSLGAVVDVGLTNGKVRTVAQLDAVPPLAVSASRGLACVFAGQRRALLYDLEEDEEAKDDEMD